MEKRESKKVKELRAGSRVDATFLLMEKELRDFVTKEGYYLQVKLGDSTGSIWAKCWERAEEVASKFDPGDVVRVRGVVESFRGRLQLIFEPEGVERSTETYDIADYLPLTTKDRDALLDEIVKTAAGIENDFLKQVLFSFFENSTRINISRKMI
jgi:Archaea-specific RecJ-like exonuclease, contains DnaJ-type Zn finger domain